MEKPDYIKTLHGLPIQKSNLSRGIGTCMKGTVSMTHGLAGQGRYLEKSLAASQNRGWFPAGHAGNGSIRC